MRRLLGLLLSVTLCIGLVGCGQKSDTAKEENADAAKVNIAYQYGLAYAPLMIVEQKNLIEEEYEKATGKQVEVTWTQMSSGADINTAIAGGSIDAGYMGVAPAISGALSQVGYKISMGLSGQEHGLMTNDKNIKSLGDLIGSDDQIAVVNIGSIQHIILAKALKNAGYDAHALDANLVGMKHPDGMASVQSGSIQCHLTSNPYIYKEREDDNLTEIPGISDVWTKDSTFIVGVASKELHDNNKEVYDAMYKAFESAIELINTDVESAAKITYELNGNTLEDEIKYMELGGYSMKTEGVFDLAVFMGENDFIDSVPSDFSELAYENVEGN